MAKSNRDLTIALIAKADQFDLKEPAQDLEKMGEAAEDAAKGLEKLDDSARDIGKVGDAAKDAGRDVEAGMEKAEKAVKSVASDETRRELDTFFDRVGKSAKQAGREVDDGMDHAKKGMDNLKDEASQSGREAAASFSGSFEDVGDFIQETLANGFAGMGKLGLGAGLAAAAGLGVLLTKINESRERVQQLAKDLIELRLNPDVDTDFEKIQEFLNSLKDAGDLNRFRDAARKAGVDWMTWVRAMALGGDELLEMEDRLTGLNDSGGGFQRTMTDLGRSTNDLRQRTREQIAALEDADDGVNAYKDGLGGLRDTTDDAARSSEDFADVQRRLAEEAAVTAEQVSATETALARVGQAADDMAGAIQEKAEKVAESTADEKDTWADYADTVKLSAQDIIDVLIAQAKAQEDFQKNLSVVAERQSADFLKWVEEQPPQVAAAYVAGTAKQRDAIFNAWKRNVGASQGEGIVAGLEGKSGDLRAAGQRARDRVQQGAGEKVVVQVGVAYSEAELARVKAQIRNRFGTVTIPVVPRQFGQGRFIP